MPVSVGKSVIQTRVAFFAFVRVDMLVLIYNILNKAFCTGCGVSVGKNGRMPEVPRWTLYHWMIVALAVSEECLSVHE